VNLTIKKIPEEIYHQLKQAAVHNRRSLNAEVIDALGRAGAEFERRRRMAASRPDLERFVASLQLPPRGVRSR
jgi:uncharacterized protein (DUF1778 family)